MNKKYGYVRVAASVPALKVANIEFNVSEIVDEIKNDVCEANEIYQRYNNTIVKVRDYTSKLEGISL